MPAARSAPSSPPSPTLSRAVVFAYHDVGVRCLEVLLQQAIEVPLVVTHRDDPGETIWFESVERRAAQHGIAAITPADADAAAIVSKVKKAKPDFLFSFY